MGPAPANTKLLCPVALAGFDDGAGVTRHQSAQHGVGVLGVAQVPGAVEGVQAGHGQAGNRSRPQRVGQESLGEARSKTGRLTPLSEQSAAAGRREFGS
jgi:hypothetical protein